jgi:hypothetical protein
MIVITNNSANKKIKREICRLKKKYHAQVFSVNKMDRESEFVEYINVYSDHRQLNQTALELALAEKGEIETLSVRFHSILAIPHTLFLFRLFSRELFYEKAKLLTAMDIIKKRFPNQEPLLLLDKRIIFNSKTNCRIYASRKLVMWLKSMVYFIFQSAKQIRLKSRPSGFAQVDILIHYYSRHEYELFLKILAQTALNLTIGAIGDSRLTKGVLPPANVNVILVNVHQAFHLQLFLLFLKLYWMPSGKFSYFINKNIPFIFNKILFLKNLLSAVKPKLFLVKNEFDIYENLEYGVMKANHIPYYNFMHGEKVFELIKNGFVEYDLFFVWGDYYCRLFESLASKKNIFQVSGRFDSEEISNYSIKNLKILEYKKDYKKILSFYSQPINQYAMITLKDHEKALKDVLSYLCTHSDVFLFIRHHPNEFNFPHNDYQTLIGDLKSRVKCITQEYNLFDMIAVSDLIITPCSTVGLEGIMFEKPVLYLNYGDSQALMEYPKYGAAIEANCSKEALDWMDKLLDHPENYLKNHSLIKKEFMGNLEKNTVFKDTITKLLQ